MFSKGAAMGTAADLTAGVLDVVRGLAMSG